MKILLGLSDLNILTFSSMPIINVASESTTHVVLLIDDRQTTMASTLSERPRHTQLFRMISRQPCLLLVMITASVQLQFSQGFSLGPSPSIFQKTTSTTSSRSRFFASQLHGTSDDDTDAPITTKKISLEEKMKSWEATEEERKAATLGGLIPEPRGDPDGRERDSAFDVGLYIAFPIMVLSGLFFALFPFLMGSIDVDSVGPPPTV